MHLPARGIQRPCMYAKTSGGGVEGRDNGSRSPQKCLAVRSREGQGDGIRFLLSFLPPLMVLRAHLLALSLSLFSGHCHIPLRNVIFLVSLAGFTTQFEEPPYRAPSSTLLVPEYSENSEATDADGRGRTSGRTAHVNGIFTGSQEWARNSKSWKLSVALTHRS